jgi:hypothetical protein
MSVKASDGRSFFDLRSRVAITNQGIVCIFDLLASASYSAAPKIFSIFEALREGASSGISSS